MKKWFGVFAAFFVFQMTAASPSAAAVDPVGWRKLVELTVEKGESMSSGDMSFRYLARVVPPDTAVPRKADYFTLQGHEDPNGVFHPFAVSLVDESWSKTGDGNWLILQWLFEGRIGGEFIRGFHFRMVQNDSGRVLEHTRIPVSDEIMAQAWETKVREWTDSVAQ